MNGSDRWKSVLAVGGLLTVILAELYLLAWCSTANARQEYRERKAALRPLLQAHATREHVVQALGERFSDYSRNSTNHSAIAQRGSDRRVRKRAARCPGVLSNTTTNWMTWLFFDADGRLQDYYLAVANGFGSVPESY